MFAPHHGRDSGKVSTDVLKKLNPHIVIIGEAPSKYLNYYSGYNTITQNSAGNIVFECIEDYVHVYIEKSSYSLTNRNHIRLLLRIRLQYKLKIL